MRQVFTDTNFWVALVNPNDELHEAAKIAQNRIGKVVLHLTDEVLLEFLNHYAEKGLHLREAAVRTVEAIQRHSNMRIHPQTRASFANGFRLYAERMDKGWSIVDCISINTMKDLSIREVLSNDSHFEQAGFVRLIR
jgi:predicted nucleic acid-binding protein